MPVHRFNHIIINAYLYLQTTLSASVSVSITAPSVSVNVSATVSVSIVPLGALPVAFCDTKQIQINDSNDAEKNRAINCVFTFCLQNASAYQRDKAAGDGRDEGAGGAGGTERGGKQLKQRER